MKSEFDLSFKITLIITTRTRAKEFGFLVQGSYPLFSLLLTLIKPTAMSQLSKLPGVYLIAQPANHGDLMINGYSMVILFIFFLALSLNFIRTLTDK